MSLFIIFNNEAGNIPRWMLSQRKLEKSAYHKVKLNIAQQTELMKWNFTPFKFKSMPIDEIKP